MLMLVMSNNLLQLFFGWEAVGLVSYLLIGFYFKKPTAIFANMKAFLVNRVGDFGFILGIGLIYAYTGTFNYSEMFAKLPELPSRPCYPGTGWLLVDGDGASACSLVPWVSRPSSRCMFGCRTRWKAPPPISALIHAATMVTAGYLHGVAHVAAVSSCRTPP